MPGSIPLDLPEEVLIEALRRLPAGRRRDLVAMLGVGDGCEGRSVPAANLDRWTGLISAGGDALEDTEQLYGDANRA